MRRCVVIRLKWGWGNRGERWWWRWGLRVVMGSNGLISSGRGFEALWVVMGLLVSEEGWDLRDGEGVAVGMMGEMG